MPDEKGLGSKIRGLFFETEGPTTPDESEPEAGAAESAADVIAELAQQSGKGVAARAAAPGAAAPARAVQHVAPSGPATPPANVDFESVFKNAGMDVAELDRVRKAEDLLKGLPEATPHEVKKQIVEASLKAFGFEVSKIAAAAQNQLKAVDTFVKVNEQQTAKAITDAQNKISQLEEQIINLRVDIEKRTLNLSGVAAAAEVRRTQVSKVLEFFNVPTLPAAPKA